MSDQPGGERPGPELRGLRAVEALFQAPKSLGSLAEDTPGPESRKAKRHKKSPKGPKGPKGSRECRDADKKKGHTKKLKATKRLAAELQGLSGNLNLLQGRLESLQSMQLDQAQRDSALTRQVAALEGLGQVERDRVEALAGQLDRMTEVLDNLGPRIDLGIAASPALQDLTGRLARAESALCRRLDQVAVGGPAPGNPRLAELEGRLADLRLRLDAQVGRLDWLERGQPQGLVAATPSGAIPWGVQIEHLRGVLEGRFQALAEGARQAQEESRRNGEAVRSWVQARLSHMGRAQVLGLGLMGILLVGLVAASWWHTHGLAPGLSGPLDTPGQGAGALALPEPQTSAQDLLERLLRVESQVSGQGRDLAAALEATAGSRGHLADLEAGQQALVERMEAIWRDLSEADRGLEVLRERMGRPSAVESTAPAQRPAAIDPPSPGRSGYAVQLVVYRSRGRIAPFVTQHGIGGRAGVMETRVGGRSAYAVLLGPYGSEPEASQALDNLSAELQALGPWVRPLPPGAQIQPWP